MFFLFRKPVMGRTEGTGRVCPSRWKKNGRRPEVHSNQQGPDFSLFQLYSSHNNSYKLLTFPAQPTKIFTCMLKKINTKLAVTGCSYAFNFKHLLKTSFWVRRRYFASCRIKLSKSNCYRKIWKGEVDVHSLCKASLSFICVWFMTATTGVNIFRSLLYG